MDRSKKMLFGCVAAVAAVVVLVVIVVVAWPRSKSHCVPMTAEPDIKELAVRNVVSSNPTLLANLVGYVKLTRDKAPPTYLPVEATSVAVVPGKDGFSTVTLTGECATVRFNYRKNGTYQYNNIEMLVVNVEDKVKEPKKVCEFDQKFEFVQPVNYYYSCQEVKTHSCSDQANKPPVAQLHLKSFEFEMEGDAEKAKKGMFTKPKWTESCQQF
jgi:hypothetical protein